jgi:hypothetical protein
MRAPHGEFPRPSPRSPSDPHPLTRPAEPPPKSRFDLKSTTPSETPWQNLKDLLPKPAPPPAPPPEIPQSSNLSLPQSVVVKKPRLSLFGSFSGPLPQPKHSIFRDDGVTLANQTQSPPAPAGPGPPPMRYPGPFPGYPFMPMYPPYMYPYGYLGPMPMPAAPPPDSFNQ